MYIPGMVLVTVISVVTQLPGGRVGIHVCATTVVVVGGVVVTESVDVI